MHARREEEHNLQVQHATIQRRKKSRSETDLQETTLLCSRRTGGATGYEAAGTKHRRRALEVSVDGEESGLLVGEGVGVAPAALAGGAQRAWVGEVVAGAAVADHRHGHHLLGCGG